MKHRVLVFTLFILYIVIMTIIMIWQGIGIAPDRYAFLLILPALLIKRIRPFIFDWIPFLFILISYDFLRGFADNANKTVHYVQLINGDKFLFMGNVPTVVLQSWFFSGSLHWYDYFFTILYFLHFALPLAFGFLLWMDNRMRFREFVTGLLMVSFAGWFTFIIYPASPPWLAHDQGYLPGVTKILSLTLQSFPEKFQLPTVYQTFNANEVAAMPSMHAAYPFLIFLFALRYFKKKAWLFFPYVLAMWLGIIYLGEHYFVDVFAGASYAFLAFFAAVLLHKHHPKILNFFYKIKGPNRLVAK